MRKLYLFAAMAAMLAACSSDDLTVEKQSQQAQQVEEAVTFGAYLNRGTRAGAVGELTNSTASAVEPMSASLQTVGFGVFGYYTDNELYSESSKPNFMYNQQVSTASWTYSPIKYWPNEYGSAAISEAQDKLTFFAYAPWVEVVPETGLLKDQTGNKNSSGIVALTRNTASGDPYVKYLVDLKPANRVDLCWGVAKENFTSGIVDGLNSVNAGDPFKNVSKPKVNDKISFEFNHTLAALNVQIDADIDQDTHGSYALAAETKIYVRSVTFEGFAAKGMFNLNASKTTPKWYDLTGNNELTSGKVTIYDGRRDGSEGQVNASAANETPNDLNPVIIQNNPATLGVPSGTDPVNLFNSTSLTAPIYVIPVSDEQLKVTVVYDVETADPNLAGYLSDGTTKGSTIENSITQSITTSSSQPLKLEAGKQYIVKLHLGMTSVKFEAEVAPWGDTTEGEPWLPINNGNIDPSAAQTPSISASGSSDPLATTSVTVTASATQYTFKVTGLTAGETVNLTRDGNFITVGSSVDADASGVATITATLSPNGTVKKNADGYVQATGATSSKSAKVIISQDFTPFLLANPTITSGNKTFDITPATGSGTVGDTEWNSAEVTIKKKQGSGDWETLTKGNGFSYSHITSDNKASITLDVDPASGDSFVVTVKMGDSDPVDSPQIDIIP